MLIFADHTGLIVSFVMCWLIGVYVEIKKTLFNVSPKTIS